MTINFTVEKLTQIWFDDCGDRIEIGPDSDSLNLIEIRHRDANGKIYARITFPIEMTKSVAAAITDCETNLLNK